VGKRGKAAEKMCRVSGWTHRAYNVNNKYNSHWFRTFRTSCRLFLRCKRSQGANTPFYPPFRNFSIPVPLSHR
jgi:hypothetical protein